MVKEIPSYDKWIKQKAFKKACVFLAILFILFDTTYTFFQHYTKAIDGDLASIVLYANHYSALKGDPFGWQVLFENAQYGGVNRYFIHEYLSLWFTYIPQFFQNFVSPVESIYYASATSKTLTHLGMLSVLALLISNSKIWSKDFLIAVVILIPLFQTGGHFYKYIGIVDQSITYSAFYAFPLCGLLFFLKPYYALIIRGKKKIKNTTILFLTIMTIVLPFSGPLVPGVVIVLACLAGLSVLKNLLKKEHLFLVHAFPKSLISLFLMLLLLCFYSIFIGQNNLESGVAQVGLFERYTRLPVGLYYVLTQKVAFPLLFLMITVILFLNRKYKVCGPQLSAIFKWICLFSFIYLMLLPFGGFREYRPNIIRRDTFIPVILALVYFYGYATYLIIQNSKFKYRNWFTGIVILFSFVFLYADEADADQALCQKEALVIMSNSTCETPVQLTNGCEVLSWELIKKPEHSEVQARLLKLWNINKKKCYYFQE